MSSSKRLQEDRAMPTYKLLADSQIQDLVCSICLTIVFIGSRIWALDWYQNRWPWMTLNGEMAIILRYFTKSGSFRGALRISGW